MKPVSSDVHALRCADCARSDSAVTDLQPTQSLPIPIEALSGELDRAPSIAELNRRQLLRGGLLGVASVYSAKLLRVSDMLDAALAEAAEPMQPSFVRIFLNGGNAPPNTIVPREATQFDASTKARASIARGKGPSA